jgi:hypothetical protein
MTWISLTKPAFVVGNFVRGFLHGSADEALSTFTDAEILRFKDSGDLLRNCEPWEKHLKEEAYSEINKALKKKNYQDARTAISKHVTETADPSCITTLKMIIVDVCTKCTTLLKEALPKKIVVPKS